MRKPLTLLQIEDLTKNVANTIDTKWDFINNKYHLEKAFERFQDLFLFVKIEKGYFSKDNEIKFAPEGCDRVFLSVSYQLDESEMARSFFIEVSIERESEAYLLCFGELANYYRLIK